MQKLIISGLINPANIDSNDSSNTAETLSTMGFTVVTSAGALAAREYERCIIFVETNSVRVGVGSPTTSLGHVWLAGETWMLNSADEIKDIKFISNTSGNHAKLHITFGF